MSRAVLSFLCIDLILGVGMSPVTASQTARARARAELTREIKEEARRQLAEVGGNGLSLRAVARELGMVSSALYRYYPSRDDLLTALIIDAYDAVGKAAEDAVAAASGAGRKWAAACHAIREWALAHPHEYALLYGSPVPGYQAPQDTIGPALRDSVVYGRIISDAWRAGVLEPPEGYPSPPGSFAPDAARVREAVLPDLPDEVVARA